MSTDIAQFQAAGLPAKLEDLQSAYDNFKGATRPKGQQFLKVGQEGSKTEGLVTWGADADEVEADAEWVVNVRGVQWGYALQKGAEMTEELTALWFENRPEPNAAKAQGGKEWKDYFKGQLVCVSGDDKGVVVEFGGTSFGIQKFYKTVLASYMQQEDKTAYPVINMVVGSYHSRTYSKTIYQINPVVVGTMSEVDLDKLAS